MIKYRLFSLEQEVVRNLIIFPEEIILHFKLKTLQILQWLQHTKTEEAKTQRLLEIPPYPPSKGREGGLWPLPAGTVREGPNCAHPERGPLDFQASPHSLPASAHLANRTLHPCLRCPCGLCSFLSPLDQQSGLQASLGQLSCPLYTTLTLTAAPAPSFLQSFSHLGGMTLIYLWVCPHTPHSRDDQTFICWPSHHQSPVPGPALCV